MSICTPLCVRTERSALLLMDFQRFVLDNFLPSNERARVVDSASRLLRSARNVGLLVIHVTVGFRPGYPEIHSRNALFSQLKESGHVAPGGAGIKIDPALAPRDDEPVVVKHRIGPFTETDLDRLLRAREIDKLILAGVTTTGVVLSALRHAFDLDYRLVVAADGCADSDETVHAFLLEKVLGQHAAIKSVLDIEHALKP